MNQANQTTDKKSTWNPVIWSWAILLTIGLQCSLPGHCASYRELVFAKAKLAKRIEFGKKLKIDTRVYEDALHKFDFDLKTGKSTDKFNQQLASIEALSEELEAKLNTAEVPQEGTKSHPGIFVGFHADMPAGSGAQIYLSTKVSEQFPLIVKGLQSDGSAYETGLRYGDRVLMIDGSTVDGLTIHQILEKLQGQANSQIMLTYSSGGKAKTVKLIRNSKALLQAL